MKRFILKKLSVLFVISVLGLLFCIKFFVFDFPKIEDFGMAGIGALMFLGLSLLGLFLDYVLSVFIKNKIILNILELLLIVYVCFYFFGYKLLFY